MAADFYDIYTEKMKAWEDSIQFDRYKQK